MTSAKVQKIIADNGSGLKEGDAHWGHGLGYVITRELLDKLGAQMTMNNRPEGGLDSIVECVATAAAKGIVTV